MAKAFREILLAEDDSNDVELALEALSETGMKDGLIITRDGAEALDYLHFRGRFAGRPEGNPAVVILDLKLPKMNGLEVLRIIKASAGLRSVPVVMLTSSREERDLMVSYELGVNAYVVKPVNFKEYMAAVKQIGAFWGILNEPPLGSAANRKRL